MNDIITDCVSNNQTSGYINAVIVLAVLLFVAVVIIIVQVIVFVCYKRKGQFH